MGHCSSVRPHFTAHRQQQAILELVDIQCASAALFPPAAEADDSPSAEFRKLSVRKAPSTFFSLKSSIAHVGRRRASTATSTFELVDSPLNAAHSDRGAPSGSATLSAPLIPRPRLSDAMTMPIELASKSPVDLENEKARLESFSRHIQHIIDARKGSQPPLPRRSVQPKPSTPDEERTEMSILSPVEVQEFAAQVAQELAEESRQKSMSREAFGPRPSRSASTCRRAGASSSQIERPPARIRPSLAPSFVGKASPPKIKSTPPRLTSPSGEFKRAPGARADELTPSPCSVELRVRQFERRRVQARTSPNPYGYSRCPTHLPHRERGRVRLRLGVLARRDALLGASFEPYARCSHRRGGTHLANV